MCPYLCFLFRFLIMYVIHDCWQQTLLSIVKGVWMLFNHKLMVVYRNNGLLQLLSVSTGWTLQFSSSTTGSNSTWELPMSKLICTERLIAENSVCGFPLAFLCSFHQLYNWRDQLNYADTDMDPLSQWLSSSKEIKTMNFHRASWISQWRIFVIT